MIKPINVSVPLTGDRLWNNAPPCGERIRYRQGNGRYEEAYGEFIFDAVDVESVLIDRLQKNTNHRG